MIFIYWVDDEVVRARGPGVVRLEVIIPEPLELGAILATGLLPPKPTLGVMRDQELLRTV